jgi:flagellar biosynthesis protein FlhA
MALTDTSALARNAGLPLSDFTLAIGVVFILAILFVPIPALLIDFGLACSLALSVLILMVALWIQRPLDFSAFPLVLLIVTMLRLALNIATTRMILAHGHEGVHAAGHVISGFSNFVMGGDFVIGIVVFLVLVIVNFVVITKGATRIAEVGARFTLDAIPGKQMSIDADLSAGIIDEKEAQSRRRELEEESAFFGSMDGASKFVRGEAIAGLVILAINVFGGIMIGYARHGLGFAEAGNIFVKLSVGDGLVSQIPALIVSLAAGLLVSKGGTRGSVDKAVFSQLGAHPRALYVASGLLACLSLMPGLPTVPFFVLAATLGLCARAIAQRRDKAIAEGELALIETKRDQERIEENSVKSSLKTSELELVFGKQLATVLLPQQQELAIRMSRMRKKFAAQYGFVVPEVRVNEDLSIGTKTYQIKIHGTSVASYEVRLSEILALIGDREFPPIPGEEVREPAFGMPALSVPEGFEEEFRRLNIPTIDNMGLVLTHLGEVIRNNLPQLLSYKDTRALVDRLEPEYRKLTDEICASHISYPGLQSVLKLLLAERVSIRNLHLIIEAIAEVAPHMRRSEKIVEHVRMRIAQQLCGDLAENGVLNVLRLGQRWDLVLHESLKRDAKGELVEFDLSPIILENFSAEVGQSVREHLHRNISFAIVTSADVRPYVRMIVERLHPSLPVLSHAEVAKGLELRVIGTVS